ncbi:unnamed protein product [Plasmodium vivax]|uniref:(malaria parasite P. vivax) hypothetical protein n=1 Tax=Plasmodium vivax TaxID=5855 RepID=A0A8S4H525_PLAVI|nr:unnamed protein product [Plasmodium vivax]
MDIEDFIKEYSFLSNMVIAYEEFNKTVTEEQRSSIKLLMTNLSGLGQYDAMHKDIYEKLLRNLSLLLNNEYTKMPFSDYCTYLYQWMYFTKKKYKNFDFMIGIVYPAAHQNFLVPGAKNQCPYFSYDTTYDDPIKIIKLQNFYNNIDTIANTLMNKSLPQEKDSHYCYAQRYANECVKIYRNMHDIFCSNNRSLSTKNQNTCSELKTFNNIYTNFLFNKEDIKNKIPDLASGKDEKYYGCPANEPPAPQEHTQGSGTAVRMETVSDSEHGSVSNGVEQPDNPIPFNTTSVVSAMAGIPPFLALIYKFTPVGNMFRRKNNKSANVFNNLDEEIEKELFYRRHGNATINSSPERYNVAYGTV